MLISVEPEVPEMFIFTARSSDKRGSGKLLRSYKHRASRSVACLFSWMKSSSQTAWYGESDFAVVSAGSLSQIKKATQNPPPLPL